VTAEPVPTSPPVTARRTLVPFVIAAFLVVQLVVPAVALFGPRPARFGWQMYSALPDLPKAYAVEADGTERLIDLQNLFAVQRAEIDYVAVLRAGLCAATGAAAIRLELTDGTDQVIGCE
jgi:hypothetical protein